MRCAIYTRKSTEEGLDQDFNSLDAQFEACGAYIASQKHEGWKQIKNRYDDGGKSGGTLERPALHKLLADIDAGLVDMIVVYKIDRLTRSLADFAKLIERLKAANCSFVSVTQAFNTSSSMGRLTLNVLLSFAQFEREVTAERIRDKIAASKKKGMWMGGNTPLGYDHINTSQKRGLEINPQEAMAVQKLFNLYDHLGCLSKTADEAQRLDIHSKRRTTKAGRTSGGQIMTHGQIHHILVNPIYCGKIRHKDAIYDGQHSAIIEDALWQRVQDKLKSASARKRGQSAIPTSSWLTGKITDETGDRLTPTHTKKNGRPLYYMISNRLVSGGKDPTGWRLPRKPLEDALKGAIVDHLAQAAQQQLIIRYPDAAQANILQEAINDLCRKVQSASPNIIRDLFCSAQISKGKIAIILNQDYLAKTLLNWGNTIVQPKPDNTLHSNRNTISAKDLHSNLCSFTTAFQLRRRGVESKIIIGDQLSSPDPKLQYMLQRVHHWLQALKSGIQITALAQSENVSDAYIRLRLPLAFLSPKIQRTIIDATQPPEYSIKYFIRAKIPYDWEEQETLFIKPYAGGKA